MLTGNDTWSGATAVNAGVLEVDNTLTASTVTVGGSTATIGSTPTLTGTGTISQAVTVSSAAGGAAGTISAGSVATPLGTLSLSSTAAFQSGSTFGVTLNGSGSNLLAITGAATISPGALITLQRLDGSHHYLGAWQLHSSDCRERSDHGAPSRARLRPTIAFLARARNLT